jgi:hypothetical protein
MKETNIAEQLWSDTVGCYVFFCEALYISAIVDGTFLFANVLLPCWLECIPQLLL